MLHLAWASWMGFPTPGCFCVCLYEVLRHTGSERGKMVRHECVQWRRAVCFLFWLPEKQPAHASAAALARQWCCFAFRARGQGGASHHLLTKTQVRQPASILPPSTPSAPIAHVTPPLPQRGTEVPSSHKHPNQPLGFHFGKKHDCSGKWKAVKLNVAPLPGMQTLSLHRQLGNVLSWQVTLCSGPIFQDRCVHVEILSWAHSLWVVINKLLSCYEPACGTVLCWEGVPYRARHPVHCQWSSSLYISQGTIPQHYSDVFSILKCTRVHYNQYWVRKRQFLLTFWHLWTVPRIQVINFEFENRSPASTMLYSCSKWWSWGCSSPPVRECMRV